MSAQLPICDPCRAARARSYRDIDHNCTELLVTVPDTIDAVHPYTGPACACTCNPVLRDVLRRMAPRKTCWLHPDHVMLLCAAPSCKTARHWYCPAIVRPGTLHLSQPIRNGIVNAEPRVV